jgi:hypothetical protein
MTRSLKTGLVFAVQQGANSAARALVLGRGRSMDPKLTILFMLIASIIGLSHLADGAFGRMRRLLPGQRLRNMMPGRRRI